MRHQQQRARHRDAGGPADEDGESTSALPVALALSSSAVVSAAALGAVDASVEVDPPVASAASSSTVGARGALRAIPANPCKRGRIPASGPSIPEVLLHSERIYTHYGHRSPPVAPRMTPDEPV